MSMKRTVQVAVLSHRLEVSGRIDVLILARILSGLIVQRRWWTLLRSQLNSRVHMREVVAVVAYVSACVVSVGSNISLIQGGSVKAVRSRESQWLLLPRVVLLPLLAETTLASVVLVAASLLVLLHYFSIHRPVKSSSSYFTWLIMLRIQSFRTFVEIVFFFVNELYIASFIQTDMFVATRLSVCTNAKNVLRAIVSVIIEESLTDIFERSGIISRFVLSVHHLLNL